MRPPTRSAPLVGVLVLVLGVSACTSREERADQARAAIAQAVARGDRTGALAAVEDLADSLPDTADALLEVAQRRIQAGDAPRAAWLLEDGVRRFRERDDLRLALARVSLLLGNPSRAREVVLAVAPGSAQHAAALVARAQAELELGDLEQALATLDEAEARHPDQPEARLVRISILLAEQRPDEARAAIAQARAALAGDDEQTTALRHRLDLTLAELAAQQGDPEAALATLRGMVEVDAADLLAWRALVAVLARAGRTAEGLPLLEASLANDAAPSDLLLIVAQVQTSLGRDAEAEAALRRFADRSESPLAVLPLFDHLAARGDAAAARVVLDEALARHPDEAALRLLRAEALLGEGRVDAARGEVARFRERTFAGDPQIEYLEARLALAEGRAGAAADRLRQLAPKLDRATTQFWLGRALEEGGDTDGALRRYGLAQARDPLWAAPWTAMVALHQRRGDWREVAATAEGLVRRAPRQLAGWVALVEALESLGEGETAEPLARACIAQFPDLAEPHVLLAKALRAQGRTDAALAALDEARRIAPGPDLAAERAVTLGRGGRIDEGIRVARASLAGARDSAALEAALASLLFAAGDADAGVAATDRALALAPDAPQPLRVRCEFRASVHDWAGAREDCTRYLAARPDDPGAQFMLGVVLRALGEDTAAAAAYRRAAALDERDPRPRNNLAELLAGRGDLEGALAAAQEAYRLDEQSPYVKDTLGNLYRERGLAERAVSLLEEAHSELPDRPGVTLHLALAYRDAGRTGEARALLAELAQRASADDAVRARAGEALGALR